MRKAIIVSTLATFASACGPHVDDEEHPPGELVYEDSYERLYRLDRRVEVIFDYEREDRLQGKCGFLTDRAYDDLERTLAVLDPNVDYGYDPEILECEHPGKRVYIEGFDHSPFDCGFECCHPDLHWAAIVYSMSLNNFSGITANIDGEPYVAIEPDLPCP